MGLSERIRLVMTETGLPAAKLARIAGVSGSAVTFWINGDTKELKGPTAARIETSTGFSARWLATGLGAKRVHENSNVRAPAKRQPVPIISWVQAGTWTEIVDSFLPIEDYPTATPQHSKPGNRAYALVVEGDSMTSFTGYSFPPGTTLIVDPDAGCGPNDYVIAKDIKTQQATFKQLVTDGGRWYLRPLNREFPTIEIDDPTLRVIGKVCEFMPKGVKLP